MRKNLFFKKSVIFIWLISYMVVFAIPVLGTVLLFLGLQQKTLAQTENMNLLLLQQSVEKLDALLIETERVSSVLELSQEIYDYTYIPSDDVALKIYKLQQIKNVFLSGTIGMSADEMSVSLYFKDMDMFLTQNAIYTSQEYYDYFYKNGQQTFEQWHEQLDTMEDRTFFKSVFAFEDGKKTDAIGYHKRIPFSGSDNQKISFFVMYNMEQYLNRLYQISFAQESAVLISDTAGTELFSFNVGLIPESLRSKDESSSQGAKFYTRVSGGKRFSVITLLSGTSGWRYVYFIPTKAFLQDYRQIFYIFILGMAVVLTAGIITIAFLLKRNYIPLRGVLQEYDIEQSGAANEFMLIKDLIAKNMNEKIHLLSALDKQKSIVQKSYLTKLLTGEIKHGSNVSEILQDIEIDFMPQWAYLVVLITVENVEDFFEGETRLGSFEKKQMVNFMFENVLGELTEKSYTGYTVPYEDSIFCIVGAEEVQERVVTEMIRYAQNVFDTNFNIQFSAAVSKVNYGYEGISEGYQQAIETIEYRVLNNDSGVALYSDEVERESGSYDMVDIDDAFFSGLLEKGKAEAAKEYLTQMLCSKPQGEKLSPRRIKCLLYEVTNAFLRSIANIYRSADKAVQLQEELLAVMDTKQSVEKYCKVFFDLIDSICEDTGSVMQNQSLAEQVKEYIQEHYSDENLNISLLAEVFHLSGGYISNMFKKEENIGILDFIGMVRIAKTKELLRETCMTLEDIYLRVGFTNKSTFIRVFKKLTGMTPMQYRTAGNQR